jgi:hypothetical protein
MVICSLSTTLKALHRSAGAVAQIIDISHLYGTSEFPQVQDDAYNLWSNYPCTDPFDQGLIAQLEHKFGACILGQHYFINGSTGALAPKWDFTSSGPNRGNPDAFVVAAKSGDIPAPDHADDVDWLSLNGTSGKLAAKVFRVETKGGQPPASVSIFQSAIMKHN